MINQKILTGAVLLSIAGTVLWADESQPVMPVMPATRPALPGGMMDRAADIRTPVYVDDSFASLEKIRTAARYERQNQTRLAIETYQQVLENFGQKLIFLSDNRYVGIAGYVRARLLAMPAVEQGEYDRIYGPVAQNAIDEALAQNDDVALRMACERYFPSTAAIIGSDQAARIAFERGSFSSAAKLWESLLDHPGAAAQRAVFLHHAAVAHHMAGQYARAEELRGQLAQRYPDARTQLGDQEQNLLADLNLRMQDQVLTADRLADNQWPMFMGNPAHNVVTNASAQAGTMLWSFRYRQLPSEDSSADNDDVQMMGMRAAMMRSAGDENQAFRGRYTFPVISDGVMFVHSGTAITAVNLASSQPAWSYPAENERSATSQVPAGRVWALIAANTYNHDSCAVLRDVVYANLAADGVMVNRRRPATVSTQTGRVVALNARTGEEIWATSATAFLPETQVALIGAPLATPQGIFVLGRKIAPEAFSQLYLFRLDARSGEVQWSSYICSTSASNGYMAYGSAMTPALMAMSDDVIYIATNQNATCAVDASLGRILWLNITETAASAQDIGSVRAISETWRVNPPVIWADRLIVADNGSPARMFERTSGKLIGQPLPVKSYGDLLAGVIDGKLVLIGNRLRVVDMMSQSDAMPPRLLPADGGKVAGRPFLTRTEIYIPMEKGLAVLPLAKDGEAVLTPWPADRDERRGEPGNVLVSNDQILVADGDEIRCYSRWETAHESRLKVIREHPHDPGAYLDLAEIAFRTDHLDIARENAAKAAELAAAQSADAGNTLNRIFSSCLAMADQSMRASPARYDQARFFYDLCRTVARGSDAQVLWRMRLGQLAQTDNKPDEAIMLYSQILADPALRTTVYQSQNQAMRAGIFAESAIRELLDSRGRQIYLRYEDQAALALRQAHAAADANVYQNILDTYPNSFAAQQSAAELADLYTRRGDARSRLNALRWLYAHVDPADHARIIAQIAQAQADLHHWAAAINWAGRGQRRFPDFRLSRPENKPLSFAELADSFRSAGPQRERANYPHFVVKDPSTPGANHQIGSGQLLVPLDNSPELQSPDDILFAELNAGATILHIRNATQPDSAARQCKLPDDGPVSLIGVINRRAVLLSRSSMVCVNLQNAQLAWQIPLADINSGQPKEQIFARPGLQITPEERADADMRMASYDPLNILRLDMVRSLGGANYSSVRVLGNKLFIGGLYLSGTFCYDLDTGKKLWNFPCTVRNDLSVLISGNEQYVLIQEDFSGSSSVVNVVSASTGKLIGAIKSTGRVIWRDISDDNILLLAGGSAVVAYDLQGNLGAPLWRRDDIKLRSGTGAALTLDGLAIISKADELWCLSVDSGETRWAEGSRRLSNPVVISALGPPVRVVNDGDLVLVQNAAPSSLTAYRSDTGDLAWEAALGNDLSSVPPFIARPSLGDRYIVQLAQGDVGNRWMTGIYVLDRLADGKLLSNGPIPLLRSLGDREGVRVSRWVVTNGGIAIEIMGNISLYMPPDIR